MTFQSAHEWLKQYAVYEEQELDKRRGVESLMQQTQTGSTGGNSPTGEFSDPVKYPRRASARMREELRTGHTTGELEALLDSIENSPELAALFMEGRSQ